MTAEEAIQIITEEITRQVGATNITNLTVTHHRTAFGAHQIDVHYEAFGKVQDYRVFKSVRGFSSSVSGLDGRSLGNPGTRH